MSCCECAETPELPLKPELSTPLEAIPNIFLSRDVMTHKIHNKSADILVMMDHGEKIMRLNLLPSRMALTAFSSFYS